MIKFLLVILGISFLSFLGQPNKQSPLGGPSIFSPYQGGTGTSTVPVKGDLLVGSSSRNYSVLSSSTDYKILTASSSAPYGIGWTSQIGSESNRLDAYLGLADITTIAVGGAASDDLNMGNNDILNADNIKANWFWATSTTPSIFAGGFNSQASSTFTSLTATTTFMGGLTVGNNAALVVNQAASANSLYINPSGNIGIGNAAPSSKLTVNGGDAIISNNGSATTTISSGVSTFAGGLISQASSTFYGDFTVGSTSTQLFVDAGGNVGIGTTGPDRKLDVLDANNPQLRLSQADGIVYTDFQMDSNGDLIMNVDGVSNQLVLDNGGNVGIGTATPSKLLHLRQSFTLGDALILEGYGNTGDNRGINLAFYAPANTNTSILGGRIIVADEVGSSGANPTTYMSFSTNGTTFDERLRIGSSGNIGIGTTTPAHPLSINSAASNAFYVNSSGQIGIGTTTIDNAIQTGGYALFRQSYGSLSEYTEGIGSGYSIQLGAVDWFAAWAGASSTISDASGTGYVVMGGGGGTATSTLTIGASGGGTYSISISVSFTVNANNQITHCAAFRNGVILKRVSAERKIGTGGDVGNLGSRGIMALSSGDVIDLRCTNSTSAGTILTINHASLAIDRIGF